jgi:hypothetical protein
MVLCLVSAGLQDSGNAIVDDLDTTIEGTEAPVEGGDAPVEEAAPAE